MPENNIKLNKLTWPVSRLGEAIERLARNSGFLSSSEDLPAPPDELEASDDAHIGKWIIKAADQLGVDAEPVTSSYIDVEKMIHWAGPALIRVPGGTSPGFLVLLRRGIFGISVITPELSVRRIRLAMIRDALTWPLEAAVSEHMEQLLINADVPEHRRITARRAIIGEQLAGKEIKGCWCLRLRPGSDFWTQLAHAHVPHCFVTILGAHVIGQIFMLLGWWLIGQGVFQGHFERAWLVAWALVIFSGIPFQLAETYTGNLIAVRGGSLFKKRLLYGILQLEPGEIRHQGAGQFLGRVMESEALEMLALDGGLAAMMAVIEVFVAAGVLAMGTGAWYHALLLLMWMVLTAVMSWRYYRVARGCANACREMTNDLVERMVGHRTRLAQECHDHWHDEEERILSGYLNLSEQRDRSGIKLNTIIANGWLILGLMGIAHSFVFMPGAKVSLAISLGGIMLAANALDSFVRGAQSIISIRIAWEQAHHLFQAAGRHKDRAALSVNLPWDTEKDPCENGRAIFLGRDLSFRHHEHGRPVLRSCSLRIHGGDRVLLEGPSGGGKSTFASLLAGLRAPESGLLLLRGLDQKTMGTDEWRRRVVSAPQFHENHVLTETFSFNLLMGRRWPPLAEDIRDAETICRELGLGELMDRMPSGFQQMVGESGWRLSHGEQSRLFIARALLQKSDLIILDESFAALDPENLRKALECVLRRAPALLVIAHP